MNIDIPALAQITTVAVTPCLPFLADITKDYAKDALKKVGQQAWEVGKAAWDMIRPKLSQRPAAQEAVNDLAAAPDNKGAQAALQWQIAKLLEAEPALVQQLAGMFAKSPATGDIIANVHIARDANEAVINIGHHNTVTQTGKPGPAKK